LRGARLTASWRCSTHAGAMRAPSCTLMRRSSRSPRTTSRTRRRVEVVCRARSGSKDLIVRTWVGRMITKLPCHPLPCPSSRGGPLARNPEGPLADRRAHGSIGDRARRPRPRTAPVAVKRAFCRQSPGARVDGDGLMGPETPQTVSSNGTTLRATGGSLSRLRSEPSPVSPNSPEASRRFAHRVAPDDLGSHEAVTSLTRP
jgi:hypothetical protein